ncbi:hypothetical protein [Vibrio phage RYC]|nr:hypothetical protein [Vibrio phage RYC]
MSLWGWMADVADDVCEELEDLGVDTGIVGDLADLADDIMEEIEGE